MGVIPGSKIEKVTGILKPGRKNVGTGPGHQLSEAHRQEASTAGFQNFLCRERLRLKFTGSK